uniref:Response regulator n=1 Tax=Enterococcus faecalis TaxID=1351 RepID=A9LN39_ENTFL|nr:vancomycin resistance response regulator transcription factor VanR-L [Enterococcus faecalis]ABX54691.1 response regulator [Enterococcus faecalis]
MTDRIVVVDDEQEIANLITTFLENEGFQVTTFYKGEDFLTYIARESISLAILDVMLPDIDGFRILQEIRKNFYFPVLMLTAKEENMDKIMGLTLGADDYITKPFNPIEVVARVKTQLRRVQKYNRKVENESVIEFNKDGLTLKKDSHQVFLFDKEITVTPIEFNLLLYLFEHQGVVVSSEELFEAVWKEKYLENNNTIMAHIARLREKLDEQPRKPKFIKTVWGVGYIIEK